MKEIKKAKGLRGFLVCSPSSQSHSIKGLSPTILVYDKDNNPIEYEIFHTDLEIMILDDEAVIRQDPTDSEYLAIDHSDKTLGRK